MEDTCAGGKWSPRRSILHRREPQRSDSWQSPSTVSGSGRTRLSTSTRCRSVWMSLVKFSGKCGINDFMGVDPESFLWAISLPVDQILQPSTTGIQNLSDLVILLAVHNDGRGTLVYDLLLIPLSFRTTDGLKQGDMKGGWDVIICR